MRRKKGILTGEPCSMCGKPTATKMLHIIEGPCHDCGEYMKIAYISTEPMSMIRGHSHLPASGFTFEEIQIAKAKGVILQIHYSKTKEESYLANTCGRCGNFSGDYFLFEEYIVPVSHGDLTSQEFNIGTACENCDA